MRSPGMIASALCALLVASAAQAQVPFLDRGERAEAAAAARASAATLRALYADPRYPAVLRASLNALGETETTSLWRVRDRSVLALRRSEAQPAGLLQRAPLAAYRAGAPAWETLLDIDALGRAENRAWRLEGFDCAPNAPRCALRLRDGDLVSAREFDLTAKRFPTDGFRLEAPGAAFAFVDNDTVIATANMPALTVRRWARGQAFEAAREIFLGGQTARATLIAPTDVDRFHVVLMAVRDAQGRGGVWRLDGEQALPLPLPPDAEILGLHKGELLVRGDGGVQSVTVDRAGEPEAAPRLAYAWADGERLAGLALTRDSALLALDRAGEDRLLRLAYDGRNWTETPGQWPRGARFTAAAAHADEPDALAIARALPPRADLLSLEGRRGGARVLRSLDPPLDEARFPSMERSVRIQGGAELRYVWIGPADALARAALIVAVDRDGPTARIDREWLEAGGVLAFVDAAAVDEPGGLSAIAADLVAQGRAEPQRLGVLAQGEAAALAARAQGFKAAVLLDPPASARPRANALIVSTADRLRQSARDALAAGDGAGYAELDDAAASPLAQARIHAITHLHLRRALLD